MKYIQIPVEYAKEICVNEGRRFPTVYGDRVNLSGYAILICGFNPEVGATYHLAGDDEALEAFSYFWRESTQDECSRLMAESDQLREEAMALYHSGEKERIIRKVPPASYALTVEDGVRIMSNLGKGAGKKLEEITVEALCARILQLTETLELVANVAATASSILWKSNPDEAQRFAEDDKLIRKVLKEWT